MDAVSLAAVTRGLAEYGILGLGWVLFLFAMLYIRVERTRYQDLVIHIITYFTKIHMLRGPEDNVPAIPFELFDSKSQANTRKRATRSRASRAHDEE